ncbi:MAG: YlaF family protein [Bacillus sp. (in: firmicutes)]
MGDKKIFLFLAILAAICMAAVGVSVGLREIIGGLGSIAGIIISLIALTAVMGYGFTLKKKFREEGRL